MAGLCVREKYQRLACLHSEKGRQKNDNLADRKKLVLPSKLDSGVSSLAAWFTHICLEE